MLQGGTQHNLAAVKAQVDFIESRFRDKGVKPNIIVHEHCGESGAIGAAIEANRLWKMGRQTSFIGLDAVEKISYITHRSEDTRCYFCKNKCLRTFIDVKLLPGVHRGKPRLQDFQDSHRRRHQAADRQQQLRSGAWWKTSTPCARSRRAWIR